MSLARLAEILARTTGLDAGALGPRALTGALPSGVDAQDAAAVARLAAALEHDAAVRRELRARLLVHETCFFRYPASFACMVEHVRRRLAGGGAPVRVLSAACSTGQEPASLAMSLLEAGVPGAAVQIDAFDVSEAAVARAQAGAYAERELASLSPERRARFTRPVPGGVRLTDEVRAVPRFVVGDLLEGDLPLGPGPYDLVLCRNLLIYLTPQARAQALEALRLRLAADGLLFVGHAEVVPLRASGWTPLEPLDAYALKRTPVDASPKAAVAAKPPAAHAPRASARRLARRPVAPPAAVRPTAAVAEQAPLIVRARRLAEEGRAEEALRLLEAEGARAAPSVDALHLAAVLARAVGRPADMERALTQALYLDPTHAAALRLAALVAEEAGDRAKARRLNERAERAERAAAAAEDA